MARLELHEAPRKTATRGPSRLRAELPAIAIALAFTLASAFGLNAYHYAIADQSITLPFVKALLHPELYPNDLLMEQVPFYYTFLWRVVAFPARHFGAPLPWLFFGVFLAALFFTFYAVHRLARTLFGSGDVAALALFFLLLSRSTVGGVETLPQILTTRGVAIPILLFALDALLRRNLLTAFALAGLAYLVHPLTTHYVLAMLLVGVLTGWRPIPYRRLGAGMLLFAGFASPLLIWKLLHTPESLQLFSADPRWIEALGLRSPHHMFPFRAGPGPWLDVLRMSVILGMGWHYRSRLATRENRMMAAFIGTVVGLCALGYVFSEVVPLGGGLLAQPFRSFVFLEYFACLYIAHYLLRAVHQAEGFSGIVFAVILSWGILIAGPRETRSAILYGGVVLLVMMYRLTGLRWRARVMFPAALAGAVVVAGAASFVRHEGRHDRYAFSFAPAQPAEWRDVQHWARAHTDRRDAFIVPPRLEGSFRVESERAIYADWVGGGLMNGNPAYGIEWLRRMRALGLRDTATFARDAATLPASAIRRIADEMAMPGRHVYLVVEGERPELGFGLRYRNARFAVYAVPEAHRGV